ncbi:MAG: phage terminase large subunit family protein, partial [Verrucomicrobiota bacterium]
MQKAPTIGELVLNFRDAPRLTFGAWAEKYLESQDNRGRRARFEFRPYQKAIAQAMFDPKIASVSIRAFSGAGKTHLFAAGICYGIDQLALETGVMFPSQGQTERWFTKKLKPFIAATPRFERLRQTKDNILLKTWENGARVEGLGANSEGTMRTTEVDLTVSDEIDAYQTKATDEGSRLAIFEKRTRGRRVQYHWRSSYPGLEGFSAIDDSINGSDDQRFFMPCPHCGHEWEWLVEQDISEAVKTEGTYKRCGHLLWKASDLAGAVLECPDCGRLISDDQRKNAVYLGGYRPTREFKGHRGFTVGCLANVGPHDVAFSSYLHQIADELERIEKARSPERERRVFVN